MSPSRCLDLLLAFAISGGLCFAAGTLANSSTRLPLVVVGCSVLIGAAIVVAWVRGKRVQIKIDATLSSAAQLVGKQTPTFTSVDNGLDLLTQLQTDTIRLIESLRAEQARAERDLDASTSLLQTAYASLSDAILVVDSAGRLVLQNPSADPVLGLRDEHVNRPLVEVLRMPQLFDVFREAIQTGATANDVNARTPLGRLVTVIASPLPSPPGGAVIVARDETDLRRLERMRSDFVSNVSHELKTPITSIQGYADTLRSGGIDDPEMAHVFLGRIIEQSSRLSEMVVDMLELSRLESPEVLIEAQETAVEPVVLRVFEDHQQFADAKSISLINSGCKGATVWSDDQSLMELLANLVKNAIEHTPANGTVSVTIDASVPETHVTTEPSTGEQTDSLVCIHVSDTGEGISRENQSRIFERFFRVDRSRNRQLGGSGLGLAIVKHSAERFGGNVSVESVLGQGSTFHVSLPGSFTDPLNAVNHCGN